MTRDGEVKAGGKPERPRASLYTAIFDELRRRVEAGVYPLESPIPTEAALCGEFSASRFTVREALRLLAETGMVGRRRGSGTYVISAEARAGYVQSMRSLSELFQYAVDTQFRIKASRIVAISAATAAVLNAARASMWLRIDGVRWTKDGSEAICFTQVHVDARYAPLLDDLAELRTPIYAAVEARGGVRIAEAVQEFSAAPMPPAVARALGAGEGAWALQVTRRYIGADGATMVCSVNWHPAGRYRYSMRLQRGEGAR